MLYGIDISGYQPGIDLSAVQADFVAVYVSGGTAAGNAHAREQVQGAVAAGRRVILYHFENDGSPGTPAQEAAWFLAMAEHVGPVPSNTLYVLDNETGNALNVPWQREWLDAVRAAVGPGVGMYAPYGNIMTGAYQPLRDAGYFLWESAYVLGAQRIDGYTVPGGRAPIPGGDPAIWQFTSSGYLPGWGGALDLNVFFGSPAQWDALAGAAGTLSTTITPLEDDVPYSQWPQADKQALLKDVYTAVWRGGPGFDLIYNDRLGRGEWPATLIGSNEKRIRDEIIAQATASVNAHTDADVKAIPGPAAAVAAAPLSDAQVQALADQLNSTLPAAVVAALAAKLKGA